MERDSIRNTVRYVVKNEHIGPIFPTKIRELNRTVYLNDGAHIKGSIFADSIQIKGGNITVDKSVFARNAIKIVLEKPGFINFKSSLATRKSILIDSKTKKNYIRIKGDLFLESAHLKNMIIYGNIYGKKLLLENSAVLGGVFLEENLDTTKCLIGTFFATDISLNDHTTLWLTNGIGRKTLNLSGIVKGFTFALPKLFLNLLKEKSSEIPDETIELINEDVKNLYKTSVEKHLKGEPEERSKGKPMGAMMIEDENKEEIANEDVEESHEDLLYKKNKVEQEEDIFSFSAEMLKVEDSVKYFGLEPRLYNSSLALNAFELNRKMHKILLNPSGYYEEDKFKKFDNAILKYLNLAQK